MIADELEAVQRIAYKHAEIHDSRTLAIHTLVDALVTLKALGADESHLDLLLSYHRTLLEDPDDQDNQIAEILEKVMELGKVGG